MRLPNVLLLFGCYFLALTAVAAAPAPQEPTFELPVQLIGFPVIIAAVRITNFVKKLAYSLNPETYASRARRSALPRREDYDVDVIEKLLVEEDVCIYEEVCARYATLAQQRADPKQPPDWIAVSREAALLPDSVKYNYLLSVLVGDKIPTPKVCRQLAGRGRACAESTPFD